MPTGIEWTDATWNPVTGCSKVSPGCAHCYAETVALRFWPTQYAPVACAADDPRALTLGRGQSRSRFREFTDVMCHEDRLDAPLRWKKPRRVFVNSMSDLFHESVPDAFIDRVFAVMALAPQHTFQILTKRAERMREYIVGLSKSSKRIESSCPTGYALRWEGISLCPFPLPNVWLIVSVENQPMADKRIPELLATPAAVRGISAEPLLGPLNLFQFLSDKYISVGGRQWIGAGGIQWVIVGGESGAGARRCEVDWVRSIVKQCQAAGVPVFVKQLGANTTYLRQRVHLAASVSVECEHGYDVCPRCDAGTVKLRDRKGGDPAEWPAGDWPREFPEMRQ